MNMCVLQVVNYFLGHGCMHETSHYPFHDNGVALILLNWNFFGLLRAQIFMQMLNVEEEAVQEFS
jgi:hypothetical protein